MVLKSKLYRRRLFPVLLLLRFIISMGFLVLVDKEREIEERDEQTERSIWGDLLLLLDAAEEERRKKLLKFTVIVVGEICTACLQPHYIHFFSYPRIKKKFLTVYMVMS